MGLESAQKIVFESKDAVYAAQFWDQMSWDKGDVFATSMKEAMKTSIESAAKTIGPDGNGQFSLFVTPEGMAEKDKQKISAYRELAKEMGFQIGPLKRNEKSGTATGTIRKL